MKTIFIVDDNDVNLMAAKTALDGMYRTFGLQSAAKMFKLLEKITPDLILLDVEMPETDGFETLAILKAEERFKAIPVIFLTAKNDSALEVRGFEMGALDFVSKPFSTPVLMKRIETHIETDKLIKESLQNMRMMRNATINILANIVENRDEATGNHVARVQRYLSIMMEELIRTGAYKDEVESWNLDLLIPSVQLHDVGKMSVSYEVLNKEDKLTEEELELIKSHCAEGERIIDGIIIKTDEDMFLLHAKRFAGYHHEKWDGTGYPNGLKGEEIPLEGRIMAIIDVYDALVTKRPYKEPLTHEEAVEIIKKDSSTHFDPVLVEAFVKKADDFWVESMNG